MYIISNKIVPNTQVSYSLLNTVFSSLAGQICLQAEYSQCEFAENSSKDIFYLCPYLTTGLPQFKSV